ncbi:MAG: lysophospholipid acyltransferase family protein [Anaerolineae bacterium]
MNETQYQQVDVSPQHLSHLVSVEIAYALGLPRRGFHIRVIGFLVRRITQRFSQLAVDFDADIAALGFREGCHRFVDHFVAGYRAAGVERVPARGPLIVAANHPGVSDALVLIAALPRDDARLVISDVPITRALPHAAAHFIHVSGETDSRVRAVREMERYLREGGAVVIFPSGHLTPDPEVAVKGRGDGRSFETLARDTFEPWSRSILLPLRRVPDCQIQVATVRGVLAPRFVRHPLTGLIPAPGGWERQRLAEFLQVIYQLRTGDHLNLAPCVSFAPPLGPDTLRGLEPKAAMAAVVERGIESLRSQRGGSVVD